MVQGIRFKGRSLVRPRKILVRLSCHALKILVRQNERRWFFPFLLQHHPLFREPFSNTASPPR